MSTATRVAFRYKLALAVKDHLRDFKRMVPAIERDLQSDNIGEARAKFVALGEALKPLATMFDGVRFERKDEQRKMRNVLQWLHRLKYPFDPKYLRDDQEASSWISIQLDSLEEVLKSLVRVQGRLDSYQTVEKSFQHGPFKIINKFGYRPDEYEGALQVFDQATDKIRSKGFGGILYGDVYLVGGSEGKGRRTWAGMYRASQDIVLLNAEARHRFSDVFTLIHEFGHRYWHKKLSGAQRDAYEDHYSSGTGISLPVRQDMWQALVKGDFSPRNAVRFLKDPNVPLFEMFKEVFGGTGMRQKDLVAAYQRGETWVERNFVRPSQKYVFLGDTVDTVTVSQYAKTGVGEDYAETFAHYVLGMTVPPEVMERFKATI